MSGENLDPYAVLGVMHAFRLVPDLVSGLASNTHAGVELVRRLCGVEALNLLDPVSLPQLRGLLKRSLGIRGLVSEVFGQVSPDPGSSISDPGH